MDSVKDNHPGEDGLFYLTLGERDCFIKKDPANLFQSAGSSGTQVLEFISPSAGFIADWIGFYGGRNAVVSLTPGLPVVLINRRYPEIHKGFSRIVSPSMTSSIRMPDLVHPIAHHRAGIVCPCHPEEKEVATRLPGRESPGMTGFSPMTLRVFSCHPAYHPHAPAREDFPMKTGSLSWEPTCQVLTA